MIGLTYIPAWMMYIKNSPGAKLHPNFLDEYIYEVWVQMVPFLHATGDFPGAILHPFLHYANIFPGLFSYSLHKSLVVQRLCDYQGSLGAKLHPEITTKTYLRI